ncbi:MAG: CPBP family glutamic-type intramembrane protease [Rubripirellula sp.]|nr:CPBP family glutamic-type intramembrane protease [Rubripirellula sp.]
MSTESNFPEDAPRLSEDATIWPRDAPDWLGWAVFVGPLAIYLGVGALVPSIWERVDLNLNVDQSSTVALVVAFARLCLIAVAVIWGLRWITKVFPLRVTPLSVVVGVIGGLIWIGLCRLNLESQLMTLLGLSPDWLGQRDAINPWVLFSDSSGLYAFLVARFALLVIAVPIAEELMLRGFLIRYLEDAAWESLPLERIGKTGLIAATAYGVLSHPSEWIAAAVWFTLVTLLMMRTKRFWDCVVAHSITNAMLGIYILWAHDWRLW